MHYINAPIQVPSATFHPKKEQDTVGIIYSFLGLVKRSTVVTSIAKYHGGRMFYLPRGDTLVRAMRDRKIYRDFTGRNHYELTNKYNLSHNQIYVILKRQRELNSKHNQ